MTTTDVTCPARRTRIDTFIYVVDGAVERDEAGHKTSRTACFVPAASERHEGREVEEQALEYCRG